METHLSTPSPARQVPPVPVVQPAGVVDTPPHSAAPANLPAWAQSDEARALLEQIIAEQPERSRVLTDPVTFGFAGRAANRLRQIFDPFLMERMAWSYRAGFDTPLFWKRRAAVLSYIDTHGPDALIARVLAQ